MPTARRRHAARALASTAIAVVALSAGTGSAQAIVGGSPAAPGQWPWMAALLDVTEGDAAPWQQYCGGVVIAPRRVLTAAHCVINTDPRTVAVLLGRTRLSSSGGHKLRVKSISVNPKYVSGRAPNLDSAVITLAADAGVAPLALAATSDVAAWPPGTPATAIGWGRLNAKPSPSGGNFYADRLRQLQEPVQSDDACENAYGVGDPDFPYEVARVVCAGTGAGDSGTCFSDSGGPLVVAGPSGWLDIGIVATNAGCAAPHYFDLFVRVDAIRSFALAAKPAAQPALVAPPRIVGQLSRGKRVRCSRGRWRGAPTGFSVSWARLDDGAQTTRGHGPTHRVSRADARHGLRCSVTATSRGGYLTASSPPHQSRTRVTAPNLRPR